MKGEGKRKIKGNVIFTSNKNKIYNIQHRLKHTTFFLYKTLNAKAISTEGEIDPKELKPGGQPRGH
jgi:hypothetical protein